MNKKMLIIIISILVICPFFILAFRSFDTLQDLIVPPKLLGEYGEIQKVFEKENKNTKITLKYPSEGEYKNSYVMFDIDKDGQKEVLVFYSPNAEETVVHIAVLDKNNENKWEYVDDINGYGSEVKSLSFVDINNSKNYEILISWSLYESETNKALTLHKVKTRDNKVYGLQTIAKEIYSYFDLVDLNSDGLKEILIAELDLTDKIPKSYVKMLSLDKNDQFKTVSQKNLDGSVSGYASLKVQKGDDNNPTMIFLDAYKGEGQMITEVIYYDKKTKSLKVPFLDEHTLRNNKTLRSPPIGSMDIDNDGEIEIPVMPNIEKDKVKDFNTIQYSNVETTEVVLGITDWYSVVNNKLKVKYSSIVNFNDLYIMMVRDEYKNRFISKYDIKQRKLTFYTNEKDINDERKLFSIITVPIAQWSENPTPGYSIIKRNDSNVYAYKIEDLGKQIGVTPERLAPDLKVIK